MFITDWMVYWVLEIKMMLLLDLHPLLVLRYTPQDELEDTHGVQDRTNDTGGASDDWKGLELMTGLR